MFYKYQHLTIISLVCILIEEVYLGNNGKYKIEVREPLRSVGQMYGLYESEDIARAHLIRNGWEPDVTGTVKAPRDFRKQINDHGFMHRARILPHVDEICDPSGLP